MGKKFPGQNVVIIGGGSVGCETADFLAPTINDRFIRNRKVTVIEMDKEILLKEVGAVRSALVLRMMKKGINILVNTKVEEVTEDTIKYSTNGEAHEITDADTLVFASGYRADTSFEDMLKEVGCKYTLIGDQAKPSSLREAISTAFEATKEI
jgi:NADH dehydrogenase FAD-containing subunit